MDSRSFFALTLILCSAGTLLSPSAAHADTLLSRATVQNLRNQVDLLLRQRSPRPARKTDVMTAGDALQTYRKAMAELRFNDNSLVRVGEQAIFQFRPDTRTVDLKKGTVLLLIPPGKGRTRVNTPNAAAGIRGSALFVRYIPETGVSIVGALTNSNIEISNSDGSQTYVLQAGQLAYVYQGQIGIYNFDLKEFHNTSPFMQDIDLTELSAVKEEMEQALAGQAPIASSVEGTPMWAKLASNQEGKGQLLSNQGKTLDPSASSPARGVPSLLESPRELLIPRQPIERITVPSVTTPGVPTPPVERPTPPVERPTPPIETPVRPTPTAQSSTMTAPGVNQLPSTINPPTRPTPAVTPASSQATPPSASSAVVPTPVDLPSAQPAAPTPSRPTPSTTNQSGANLNINVIFGN